jgi:hypothetical protein
VNVYCMTCESYYPTLPGFAYQFNRHWGADQQVTVVGFAPLTYENLYPVRKEGVDLPETILPPNFSFLSLGNQEDYPVGKWSDMLIRMLEIIADDYPIIMLEDYWLLKPVKRDVVDVLYQFMTTTKTIIKMDLCAERMYSAGVMEYGEIVTGEDGTGIEIVKSDYKSPYHMSLMVGIYNRNLMLHVLQPGWSPWEVELIGTPTLAAYEDQIMVLGTKQYPVRHTLIHRGGGCKKYLTDELSSMDNAGLKELRRLGFIQDRE